MNEQAKRCSCMSYTPTDPAPSKSGTKNAQGTGDFDLSNVRKKVRKGPTRPISASPAPPEAFLMHFFWCSKDLGVYPSGNSNGGSYRAEYNRTPAGSFFGIFFEKIRWTPKIGGILRMAPALLHKSEATVIESIPIFPRTERVLAESPATMRESCSPEMKRIWPF